MELLLSLEMKSENGFIHNTSEEKYVFNFFLLGNPAEFVVEGNRYFGFQKFLLLLSGCHILKVYQNLLTLSRYETLFLICTFEMVSRAGEGISGVGRLGVSKTVVFETHLRLTSKLNRDAPSAIIPSIHLFT